MARVREDETVRVLASRYVPGQYVGEFQHHDTRPDDPNDIFPHEKRRELRGYRVFAAWLNHDDSRSLNGLFPWVMFWVLIGSNWVRLSGHKRGWFVRVHSLGPSLSRSSDTRNQPGDWDVS
jgi:hypothetical protein